MEETPQYKDKRLVGDAGAASWLAPRDVAPSLPDDPLVWQLWCEATCRAGLAGLVLRQLRQQNVTLPELIEEQLQQTATCSASITINAMDQLEGVLATLNAACIPVMLLKGAALQLGAYNRPDLRPMSDVDLLVRPQDAVRAVDALRVAGCRRGVDLIRDDFFPEFHYEAELLTASPNPLRIDLHARPFRPLPLARMLPTEAFWDGAKEVSVGSATALVPRGETMLIHLAAHAGFHDCARLIWLYDLRRLVASPAPPLDWSRLIDKARQWHVAWAVRTALDRAEEVFGAFVPDDARRQLRARRPTWRERIILWQAPRDAQAPVAHVAVNLLCTPGLGFRLRYLRSLLTPGAAHLADIYPYRHWGWKPCAQAWRLARRPLLLGTRPVRAVWHLIRRRRPLAEHM